MRIEKYKKNMFLSFKTAFIYRENFFISIIMRFIVVLITLYLWKAVYAGQEDVGGYNFTEMILYLFLANFIYGLGNFDDFSYEFVGNILQGKISNYLLRPVPYGRMAFFECIGQKLVFMPIDFFAFLIPLVIVALYNHYGLSAGVPEFGVILLTITGGAVVGFLISFILGMVAFYIENPTVLIFMKGEVFSLLSGSLIPLDMFPDKIRAILEILPVKFMGYFQSSLLLGNTTVGGYAYDLLLLAGWILSLAMLAHCLWKLALAKYIANGG